MRRRKVSRLNWSGSSKIKLSPIKTILFVSRKWHARLPQAMQLPTWQQCHLRLRSFAILVVASVSGVATITWLREVFLFVMQLKNNSSNIDFVKRNIHSGLHNGCDVGDRDELDILGVLQSSYGASWSAIRCRQRQKTMHHPTKDSHCLAFLNRHIVSS